MFDVIANAQCIGYVHHTEAFDGTGAKHLLCGFDVEDSVVTDGNAHKGGSGCFGHHLPWHDIGMVLEFSEQDPVAGPEVASTPAGGQ